MKKGNVIIRIIMSFTILSLLISNTFFIIGYRYKTKHISARERSLIEYIKLYDEILKHDTFKLNTIDIAKKKFNIKKHYENNLLFTPISNINSEFFGIYIERDTTDRVISIHLATEGM